MQICSEEPVSKVLLTFSNPYFSFAVKDTLKGVASERSATRSNRVDGVRWYRFCISWPIC